MWGRLGAAARSVGESLIRVDRVKFSVELVRRLPSYSFLDNNSLGLPQNLW